MARYTAKEITVLEGLEPVRKRPGMYIGSVDAAGLHHLLWELVDNSVDEAMNGHCDRIEVTLEADGETVSVADNGRGIPVDRHARYGKPAVELILTTLHAGGKFEAGSYYHSGGLHGVGASVVTALSDRLEVRVRRDGAEWEQRFARGCAVTKLRRARAARGSGTRIEFHPDPEIFPEPRFDPARIAERLEAKAYLHRGLKVIFDDRRSGKRHVYHYEEGIRAYLEKRFAAASARRVRTEPFYAEREADGVRLECALGWTEGTAESFASFVNGIPTPAGGSHESGLRAGLVKAVRASLERHGRVPRGLAVAPEDVREGVVGILSCFLPNPQFQGQTKERLNNPELTALVDGFVRGALENWLLAHPSSAEAIAERVVLAARARTASRAAAREVVRKTAISHRLNLPGKLADCSSTDPSESELFLVEGDSAGGSAKQGRDRHFQAVLPLRGKVLNTEQASAQKIRANAELKQIVQALGCGMGPDLDLSKLRYHKVCLLMDADSDGNHIATLLMTFFYRHMPELVRAGHLYLAVPPLYRIDIGKETYWARDDAERDAIVGTKNGARVQVQRFKGLGEMNPATLKETTLAPGRRTLLRVTVEDPEATDQTIATLLGREVAPRFRLIMDRATAVADVDV